MKHILALAIALVLCTSTLVPALSVDNPAFSVEIKGTLDDGKLINDQSTLVIAWQITANVRMVLRNTQGLRLAYDNTVLQLARWDATGLISDSSTGTSFASVSQAGLIGDYRTALSVRTALNPSGNQGYLNISLGDYSYSYSCQQGVTVTLAQVRFAFRQGKSVSDLSAQSIRCMNVSELAATSQSTAILINTYDNASISHEYLRQERGAATGGDKLNAPKFNYPYNPENDDDVIGDGAVDGNDDGGVNKDGLPGDTQKDVTTGPTNPDIPLGALPDPGTQDALTGPEAQDEASDYINPYTDVQSTNWFYNAVKYVTENGLMNGTDYREFSPDIPMTRAMFALILYRLNDQPDVIADNPFTDVPEGQWYTDAILWANENGLMLGTGSGIFEPSNNITREQVVTVLYRYAEGQEFDISNQSNLSGYIDAVDISDWALDAVTWAVGTGVIKGRSTTTLVPQGLVTRAEVAQILLNFL